MTNLNDFITIKEASQILGVCGMTLRRWDNSGRFKSVRHPVNRYRLYKRQDLEELLKRLSDPNREKEMLSLEREINREHTEGLFRRLKHFKKHKRGQKR